MPLRTPLLGLLLGLAACSCFRLERLAAVGRTHTSPRRAAAPVLMAKSKKPDRKKPARKKPIQDGPMMDAPPPPLGSMSNPAPPEQSGSRSERLDAVLRGAGLSQSDSAKVEAARPQDQSPLASIPVKGQELLERFFGTGALLFGGIFIAAGIGVSIEATCKITGYKLPVILAEAIVQYVEPALTPSILILFGFSISLGLLKQVRRRLHPPPPPTPWLGLGLVRARGCLPAPAAAPLEPPQHLRAPLPWRSCK
jgi:hypothetical protein